VSPSTTAVTEPLSVNRPASAVAVDAAAHATDRTTDTASRLADDRWPPPPPRRRHTNIPRSPTALSPK
jgi:hypothetical protein